MKQGPLPSVDSPDDMTGPTDLPTCGPLPTRVGVTGPAPDEPLGVVAVGPAGAERRAVLATLLGLDPVMLDRARRQLAGGRDAKVPTRAAFVPGLPPAALVRRGPGRRPVRRWPARPGGSS